jgi:phage shock protein PspC (stress-responsive transcriptional regulator)
MRTVITISLNGNAYQLDAGGYEALRAYLQVAEQRLAGNPDQMEILADLEQAIADKCRRYLGPHKNVVNSEEVAEVLREMGPVDGGAEEASQSAAAGTAGSASGAAGAAGSMGGESYGAAGGYASAGQNGNAGPAGAGASGYGETAPSGAGGYGGTAAGGASGAGGYGGTAAGAASGAGSYGGTAAGGASGAGSYGGTAAGGASGAGSYGRTAAGGTGDAASASGSGSYSNTGSAPGEATRRLYQIREGAVISGVCKGLAAYLNIDVSIIRILFVALAILTGGVWILVYIVMMFVIPYAQTSEQHAAAHGWPFNAEELVARAKAHYAQFRENGGKWQRRAYREQRRMWRSQHKQWKEHQRAWERWAGLGTPPPPPPPPPAYAGQQPPNPSYSAQLLHGVLSPIVGILSFILLFTFIWTLIAMVKHHTLFGWWLPHDIPLWVGIVFLVVLYRAIASPLHQARHAAYYGAPVGHAWVALVGALIWLALVVFLGRLAWQHWDEVLDFMQRVVSFFQGLIDHRAAPSGDPWNAGLYFLCWGLGWGVPSCALPGYLASRELESHGKIDSMDILGDAADRDEVDAGFGDRAYGLQ